MEEENSLKMPFYTDGRVGPTEVIDVRCIDYLVGRIKDRGKWAVVDRHSGVMGRLELLLESKNGS